MHVNSETATGADAAELPDDMMVEQHNTGQPDSHADNPGEDAKVSKARMMVGRIPWTRVLGYAILPAVALLLALGAGVLKFQAQSARNDDSARIDSVRAATDSTIALLSYRPDTVEKDLGAARDRLTGNFRDAYTTLTHDVVIPGSQQKQISAAATVAAAAPVSAGPNRAVVLIFVNQTITIGQDSPTDTASTVKITLDRVGSRWLISEFEPV